MKKALLLLAAALVGYYLTRPDAPLSTSLPTGQVASQERVQTIVDDGSNVELEDHLQPGAWTLFEYTAEW